MVFLIRTSRLALLGCVGFLAGCGAEATPPSGYAADSVGPHGGILVPLPMGRGFGEVLSRPLPKPSSKADSVLAVYFLAFDKAGPLTPPPSNASLKIRIPGEDAPADVPLKLKADARDVLAGSLFVSGPGLYAMDQLFGDLDVTLDGASTTIPFEKHR